MFNVTQGAYYRAVGRIKAVTKKAVGMVSDKAAIAGAGIVGMAAAASATEPTTPLVDYGEIATGVIDNVRAGTTAGVSVLLVTAGIVLAFGFFLKFARKAT